jgi:hypothetical protein
MRTINIDVYEYDELSEDAKEKAREWCADWIGDYDWWNFVYDNAKQIGLNIESFDLYRHEIDGKLTVDAVECAENIKREHGEKSETYKTAHAFLKEYALIPNSNEDKQDEAVEEFERSLLEDYRGILQKEWDAMFETENLEETIRLNEYTFTSDGKRFG